MKVLNINKTNILHDFKRLSDIWDSTENITLQLDIKQSETKAVVRALTSCLPNDLAYSIMSEIAENEKLDDDLMQLIFEKGDKGLLSLLSGSSVKCVDWKQNKELYACMV